MALALTAGGLTALKLLADQALDEQIKHDTSEPLRTVLATGPACDGGQWAVAVRVLV